MAHLESEVWGRHGREKGRADLALGCSVGELGKREVHG